MKKAGRVVALVFEGIKDKIVPGISTQDVADMCEKIIRDNGATPTFLNYYGYPGAVCVSVNDELVQRLDDNEEALTVRLDAYTKSTKPLLDFYEKKGLLKTFDGTSSVELTPKLLAYLGE